MITVCIPVFISTTSQLTFLKEALLSIQNQWGARANIIVSDASSNLDVQQLCLKLTTERFPIIYFRTTNAGIGENTNLAVEKAKTEKVKILFQDDFLKSRVALLITSISLSFSRSGWIAVGCDHFDNKNGVFYNRFRPRVSDHLLSGKNTISSPSVIAFRKGSFRKLRTDIDYLVDCEWYVGMSHKNGLPTLIPITLVTNRIHPDQASNWAQEKLEYEIGFVSQFHSETTMASECCICSII